MMTRNLYQAIVLISVLGTSLGWEGAPRVKRAFLAAPITKEGPTAKEEIARAMEKKDKYEEFKNAVLPKIKADWMKKEVTLVKFFNAAQQDSAAAIALMDAALAWRKDNSIDGILDEDMKDSLGQFGNAGIKGKDQSGRLVSYLYYGKWRLSEAIKSGSEVLYERTIQYLAELSAVEVVKEYEAGGKYSRGIGIFDFDNWRMEDGLCTGCSAIMVRLGQVYDRKYPHQSHKWICINVPLDFHLFLNLIRVVLSKETNENMLEYGRKKSEWKPELQKIIDSETLKEMMYNQEGYNSD